MKFLKMFTVFMTLFMTTSLFAETITLTDSNMVVLKGTVTGTNIAGVAQQLFAKQADPLYLYISSPGGSIYAGMQLVNILNATDKNIICIADTAASMAFIILQACPKRVVLDNSILMQHVASYGLDGEEPNNFSYAHFVHRETRKIDKDQAERIGITWKEFRSKVRNDWWLHGAEAVKANVADEVVKVSCAPELGKGTVKQAVQVLFWTFNVEYSKCPMVSAPISVSTADIAPNIPKREYEVQKYNDILEQFDIKNWTINNPDKVKQLNRIGK